jgi:hypothetical protein
MQHRSKFDLAVYMARSSSSNFNNQPRNPTQLSDEILRLIKVLLLNENHQVMPILLIPLLRQNKAITYQQFIQRLHKYLIYSPKVQNW